MCLSLHAWLIDGAWPAIVTSKTARGWFVPLGGVFSSGRPWGEGKPKEALFSGLRPGNLAAATARSLGGAGPEGVEAAQALADVGVALDLQQHLMGHKISSVSAIRRVLLAPRVFWGG